MKVKPSGFSLRYKLDEVLVTVVDHEGEEVFKETFTINKSFPVAPTAPIPVDLEPISLKKLKDLSKDDYDKDFQGKTWTITLKLTGTKTTTGGTKLVFK